MNPTLTTQNTGVIISPPCAEDLAFGALPNVLNDSADWRPYECDGQWQKDMQVSFETNACMSFTATNNIATYLNWLIATGQILPAQKTFLQDNGYIGSDGKVALSPRFTAYSSGTTVNGNDFQNVWYSVSQEDGVVPDSLWPMPVSQINSNPSQAWALYYAKPSAQAVALGKEFLKYFSVHWKWLVSSGNGASQAQFVTWLKTAPIHIAIAVCGNWNTDNPIMGCGTGAAHGVQLSYVEPGGDDFILDHYVPFDKKLGKDYTLSYAVQAWVSQNTVAQASIPATPAQIQEVASLTQLVALLVQQVKKWISTHTIKAGLWE